MGLQSGVHEATSRITPRPLCRPTPKHFGRDTIVIDAKLLAADRALDQAWRGGVGVAMAITRAQELSDPLRLDVLFRRCDGDRLRSPRLQPRRGIGAALLRVVVHQAPAPRYRV